MEEIWRDIDEYENYQISSWGRVYSKERHKYLIPETTEKGYLRVDLNKGGVRKHYKVHRLVAGEFIPNPLGKPQVNHIDGNKKNNSVSNLEWVTNRENYDHARAMRLSKKGETNEEI